MIHSKIPYFPILNYPLHIQSVLLPNGPFDLYVPVPEKVQTIYKANSKNHDGDDFPYWTKLWASSVAMAAFIQKEPEWVEHKRVFEIAAGLGLPSLVAAQFAKQVICTDAVAESLQVVQQSAKMNALIQLETRPYNWKEPFFAQETEVVLMSDVNYNPAAFEPLEKRMNQILNQGCTIILSTPPRLSANIFMQKWMHVSLHQEKMNIEEQGSSVEIALFVLKKASGG